MMCVYASVALTDMEHLYAVDMRLNRGLRKLSLLFVAFIHLDRLELHDTMRSEIM